MVSVTDMQALRVLVLLTHYFFSYSWASVPDLLHDKYPSLQAKIPESCPPAAILTKMHVSHLFVSLLDNSVLQIYLQLLSQQLGDTR